MSKGQEDMANLMKKTLNKESMTQEEYRIERERSEKQKRSERILTKIADIKDGDDPEVYLESLKNKLLFIIGVETLPSLSTSERHKSRVCKVLFP